MSFENPQIKNIRSNDIRCNTDCVRMRNGFYSCGRTSSPLARAAKIFQFLTFSELAFHNELIVNCSVLGRLIEQSFRSSTQHLGFCEPFVRGPFGMLSGCSPRLKLLRTSWITPCIQAYFLFEKKSTLLRKAPSFVVQTEQL